MNFFIVLSSSSSSVSAFVVDFIGKTGCLFLLQMLIFAHLWYRFKTNNDFKFLLFLEMIQ
jgi:hypothetical protein